MEDTVLSVKLALYVPAAPYCAQISSIVVTGYPSVFYFLLFRRWCPRCGLLRLSVHRSSPAVLLPALLILPLYRISWWLWPTGPPVSPGGSPALLPVLLLWFSGYLAWRYYEILFIFFHCGSLNCRLCLFLRATPSPVSTGPISLRGRSTFPAFYLELRRVRSVRSIRWISLPNLYLPSSETSPATLIRKLTRWWGEVSESKLVHGDARWGCIPRFL